MGQTAFPFRVVDDSNALVAGATVAVGGVTLVSGTPAAVTGKKLLDGTSLSVSVTYLNLGNGDYLLLYDVSLGASYFPLTVSKGGSTITGANALKSVVAQSATLPLPAQDFDSAARTDINSRVAAVPSHPGIPSG